MIYRLCINKFYIKYEENFTKVIYFKYFCYVNNLFCINKDEFKIKIKSKKLNEN